MSAKKSENFKPGLLVFSSLELGKENPEANNYIEELFI